MRRRSNRNLFCCFVAAFLIYHGGLLANDCLTPPGVGIEWYPQATSLKIGSPSDPPFVQVGGHLTPGFQLLLDGVPMTPDAQGLFGIVFAAPAEPTRYEWTLVDPRGRSKTQGFVATWQQPFSGQSIPSGAYQIPDYLAFTCEPGPNLNAPIPEWAPFVSLNLLALLADTNRASFSPELAWVPRIELFADLHGVGNVGVSLVRYDSQRAFAFFEAQIALRYRFFSAFSLEAAAGAHLLLGTDTLRPNWRAGLVYSLDKPIWNIAEFFASYGSFSTHVGSLAGIKVGATWTF